MHDLDTIDESGSGEAHSSSGNRLWAVHAGLIILTFLVMLSWTWFGWPDPLVDFGRELYVPRQIALGKVLFRDIAYFNGPFSPYFNALAFKLAGDSLQTLVGLNVLLLAGLTWMIWVLWARIFDRFAATVCCMVLLTVFSFLQLIGINNFNFITPYSHEITHGIILSVAGLICLSTYLQKRRMLWLGGTGVMLGLVCLTKAEVSAAALVGLGIGVGLSRPAQRDVVAFVVGFVGMPALAWVLLATPLGAGDAFWGVMGSWGHVVDSRVTGLLFYRRALGTAQLETNVKFIVGALAVYAGAIGVAVGMAMLLKRQSVRGTGTLAVVLMLFGGALAYVPRGIGVQRVFIAWDGALAGLTIVLPLLAVWSIVRAFRDRSSGAAVLRAAVICFGAALLAKILLHVRTYHYGFALAMPATLLTLGAALSWLPTAVERKGGYGTVVRTVLIPFVVFFVATQFYFYHVLYTPKLTLVGEGANSFWSDPVSPPYDLRGAAVNAMLEVLAQFPPERTLICLPEGVMINYLSHRTNPTPYINFMPPEIIMFGEESTLRALDASPPDLIVVNRISDPAEYGFRKFGDDYGQSIVKWIIEHYEEIDIQRGPQYPLRLYRKR